MFLNFQICSKQNDRYQFGCLGDNGVVPCRKMQLDPEGEKHFASFKYVVLCFFKESKRKPTKKPVRKIRFILLNTTEIRVFGKW